MDYAARGSRAKHMLRPYLSATIFEDPRFRPPPITHVPMGGTLAQAVLAAVERLCSWAEATRRPAEAERLLEKALQAAGGNQCKPDQEMYPQAHLALGIARLRLGQLHAARGRELHALVELKAALVQMDTAWRRALMEARAKYEQQHPQQTKNRSMWQMPPTPKLSGSSTLQQAMGPTSTCPASPTARSCVGAFMGASLPPGTPTEPPTTSPRGPGSRGVAPGNRRESGKIRESSFRAEAKDDQATPAEMALQVILADPPVWFERSIRLAVEARRSLAEVLEQAVAPPPSPTQAVRGASKEPAQRPRSPPEDLVASLVHRLSSVKVKPPPEVESVDDNNGKSKDQELSSVHLPSVHAAYATCDKLLDEAALLERVLLPSDDGSSACDMGEEMFSHRSQPWSREVVASKTPVGGYRPAVQVVRAKSDLHLMRSTALRALPKKDMADVLDQVLRNASPHLCEAEVKGPQKGDIAAYMSPPPKPSRRRRKVKARSASMSQSRSLLLDEEKEVRVDPFTEWRDMVAFEDCGKMNFVQLQCRTFEGMTKLKHDFKYMNSMFKHVDLPWLESLAAPGEDRLFENKLFFSESGLRIGDLARAREEAWRLKHHLPSPRELKRTALEKELFASLHWLKRHVQPTEKTNDGLEEALERVHGAVPDDKGAEEEGGQGPARDRGGGKAGG